MLRALCITLWASLAGSTASGYDSWTCNPSQHTKAFAAAGAFGLRLLSPNSSIATGYMPGLQQTIELYSVVPSAKIAGVVAGAFTGARTACPSTCGSIAGYLTDSPGTTYSRPMSGCIGGMTHTSAQSLTLFKLAWTSPISQRGVVSIWIIIVGSGDTYEAISATYTDVAVSTSPISVHITVVPSATPTLNNTTFSTTTILSRRSHSLTLTPTPMSMLMLTLTLIPTQTMTLTLTPTIPPDTAVAVIPPLNIAAVSITAILGLVGVVFVLYHIFQNKKRHPVFDSTKNESVITVMPRGLSYV